jgi:hypothetical protein
VPPSTQPSGGKAVGWRGDGTGLYPDANPPLDWQRVAKSVKELSAQSSKPKDDAPPAKDAAIPDGVIRHWLVLGPMPLTDGKGADDLLTGVDALSPNEGDKAGNFKWTPVALETDCMDLCALLNIAPDRKGFAAYAHTYLYSPSGQAVAYNFLFQGQGTCRMWLNGVQIYGDGKNVDIGPGTRAVLPLRKGWNRLLVLNAKTINDRKSWWFTGCLYGEKTDDYDTHGILWATHTPGPGSSAPLIAGDRIYLTSEGGSVVCINKADGKILWVRSLTYYDFATKEERAENPESFTKLDGLVQKLKQLDESDAAVPYKAPASEAESRVAVEGRILKEMTNVAPDHYRNPAQWGCEAGFTACTPVTDGHNVYALFGTGIIACYDRDGACKWKRLVKHRTIEHGYTTSPMLVDGKLVIYFDDFTELDPATGNVLAERPHFPTGTFNWYSHFHGTGCVLPAGGEKVLYYLNGEFVRLSDGKTLAVDNKKLAILRPWPYTEGTANRVATPVVDNGVVYKLAGLVDKAFSVVSFNMPPLQGDKADPEILREVHFDTDKFPYYYGASYCASPLLHNGLLYCVDDFGVLTVLDMAKGEVAYQRLLDLDIFMPYASAGLLKGGASSSPTLAGKYIYIWGNQGTCLVIEPGRTYKQVAKNRLEFFSAAWPPHQEATTTEPVFEGAKMYYRGECTLYCIGAK